MFLSQLINGVIVGSSYIMMASGLTLIFGILRYVNLAHGEKYMLGAFCSFFLIHHLGLNFWLGFILTMAIMAVVGVIVEKVIFKPVRYSPYMVILTISIAFSMFLIEIANIFFGAQPRTFTTYLRAETLAIGDITVNMHRVMVVVVAAVIIAIISIWINNSKTGKAMRATPQSMEATQLMGINLDYVASVTFAVGSSLAAASGAMMAPIFYVSPSMGMMPFMKSFCVVITGGRGSLKGAVVAGLLLGIVETMASAYISPVFRDATAFIFIIIVLLVRPTGLFGGD